MNRTPPRRVCSLAALVFIACAHEGSASAVSSTPETAATPSSSPAVAAALAARSCSADEECSPSELCVASRCAPITPDMAECTSTIAHFGFDQYTLQDADLPALQRTARCLTAAHGLRFEVAGHADERGTRAYNVALGERRAAAVRAYLVKLGASANQVLTVSYGKEQPVCVEHDEACWARNRRAQVGRGL